MIPDLLFVDNDPATREKLVMQVPSDWKVTCCDNSFDAIKKLREPHSYTALILKKDSTPMNACKTRDYIRNEIGSDIIIIVRFCETYQHCDETDKNLHFVQDDMGAVIAGISGKKNVSPPEPNEIKQYSLNYLEELSGDHTAFITESLKIFMTSITEKIAEMHMLLKEANYDDIADIAHSIKPSFQMIGNKRGTVICELLNHKAPSEEIPDLVTELEAVFTQIKNQLRKGFPGQF